jgi:hypothetical protein
MTLSIKLFLLQNKHKNPIGTAIERNNAGRVTFVSFIRQYVLTGDKEILGTTVLEEGKVVNG